MVRHGDDQGTSSCSIDCLPLFSSWRTELQVLSRQSLPLHHFLATSPSTLPALSVPTAACCDVNPCTVASGPNPRRGRRVHWGPVEHGNGSDWCVTARSCTRKAATMSFVGVSTPNPARSQSQEATTIDRTGVVTPPSTHRTIRSERRKRPPLGSLPTRDNRATIHENASAAG